MTEKEYFYIGYYVDTNGNYILKIGTTNELERRRKEHTRNYRKAKTNTLPPNAEFQYIWYKALSKYNTLRVEDKTRQQFIAEQIGKFVRNDRFLCETKPNFVNVTIRKTYQIAL